MKVTLIAGSNRKNSTSTSLLQYIESLLTERDISVAFVDLFELPLPLFSPDNWEFHPNAKRVLEAVADGDGLIIATPEYHGSVSGTLKNALDYVTGGQMAGKPVLAVSSAGGPLGVSSLSHLQTIVRNLHGINCSEWISLGHASTIVGADDMDDVLRKRIEDAVHSFVDLTRRLAAGSAAAN
ncbi:NADPH-dependent FMN reductase [Paenibacillus sp. GCM10023248]|uniref:NADPH-dependent FMN reductase n=1 Tax=unclassified Paenibacillus TaxID=185978 RepID=UPI0023788AB1|nr:NADPH-dependent FMN reductase [Paenibacillus sp. MAHUQ-63]MDD9265784.1 NAD(P)H-dependent oxidoreductase [Paenibacillus sp. MAHUQ-63]